MTQEQFLKEFKKIQKFLDLNDWDMTVELKPCEGFMGEVTNLDYKRFRAYITFDDKIIEEGEETIRMVIMHELSHVFTISSLRYFRDDDYMIGMLGRVAHSEMVTRMDIINEQMTVRLERVLSKLYKR